MTNQRATTEPTPSGTIALAAPDEAAGPATVGPPLEVESREAPHRVPVAYCLFTCAGRPCAVAVESVVEIIESCRLVRIPLGPPGIAGLCSYRGGILPVASARDRRQHPIEPATTPEAVLILRTGRGPLGLRIDRAGVVVTDSGRVAAHAAPPVAGFLGVAGELRHAGVLHTVLDAADCDRTLRQEVERWYATLSGTEPVPAAANPRPEPAPSSASPPLGEPR